MTTLPDGFSRIVIKKTGDEMFDVSALSDDHWEQMSEEEELTEFMRTLPDDPQEITNALNACELFVCATYYLDNGRVMIDSLTDHGEGDDWVKRYHPVYAPLMPEWTLTKALDELDKAPKIPVEDLVKNKGCLEMMKLAQRMSRLWTKISQEDTARRRWLDTKEEADEDDEHPVFSGGEEDEEGNRDLDGEEVEKDEKSEDENSGDDILVISTSAEDRKSLGESEEEKPRIRIEDGILVKHAKPYRSRAARKEKDVRKKYQAM